MSKKAPASAKSPTAQADILSYRHPDRRKNNPEVGMVTPATDPDDGKTAGSTIRILTRA
jgi:adenine-specific DNA-methyltransferase